MRCWEVMAGILRTESSRSTSLPDWVLGASSRCQSFRDDLADEPLPGSSDQEGEGFGAASLLSASTVWWPV